MPEQQKTTRKGTRIAAISVVCKGIMMLTVGQKRPNNWRNKNKGGKA